MAIMNRKMHRQPAKAVEISKPGGILKGQQDWFLRRLLLNESVIVNDGEDDLKIYFLVCRKLSKIAQISALPCKKVTWKKWTFENEQSPYS